MVEMMLFTVAVLLACVAVWVKRWCDRRDAEKAEFVKVLAQARWAMITSKKPYHTDSEADREWHEKYPRI
jgi:uncharacterized membrane protein YhaH (DUF805 family)